MLLQLDQTIEFSGVKMIDVTVRKLLDYLKCHNSGNLQLYDGIQ